MRFPRSFGLDKLSGVYLWASFIIAFSIWSPKLFPTSSTVHLLASSQAVAGLLALALLVPLVAGAYDLSVGATANLSGIVAVVLQTHEHLSIGLSLVIAILLGLVIGITNGFIVVRLKVNSFIATLGVGSVLTAFETIVSGNSQPLPPESAVWSDLTQKTVGGFQVSIFYLLGVALILWWALGHTPFGRHLYAIGGNSDAARLSGVAVDRWLWFALLISSTLSAVAGCVYASLLGPSLTFGQGLLLPAFAAVFLGSTQFRPGRFNVWGTLLAIYALATGVQGFEYVTGVQWLSDMFNGVALVAAVAFAVWRQRVSARRVASIDPPATLEMDEGDSNLLLREPSPK